LGVSGAVGDNDDNEGVDNDDERSRDEDGGWVGREWERTPVALADVVDVAQKKRVQTKTTTGNSDELGHLQPIAAIPFLRPALDSPQRALALAGFSLPGRKDGKR
jgi:hypothetical protein